jgi:hypothetical protein
MSVTDADRPDPASMRQASTQYAEHWARSHTANNILQGMIGHLLTRPVGRPSNEVRRFHASFSYRAQSWVKPRRVVAKLKWHPGGLYPRIGFGVTNLSRSAERVVAFYNHSGTSEQWIKEGKGTIRWTRLSCHSDCSNLGNFMRTLTLPKTADPWSFTSLRQKLIKIGAKVVSHGRCVTFQKAEVAVPRQMFSDILTLIVRPRALPAPA